MISKIRLIKKSKKKKRFSQHIEEKARELTNISDDYWEYSPEAVISKDISLTLNHINGIKQIHKSLEEKNSRLQCYFDTKLMQLWPGIDEHLPYLWREQDELKIREKEKWQEKLLKLEEERGKLSLSLEEKLQPLHDRLLSLMNKLSLIKSNLLENGHRKTRSKA